MCCRSFCWPPSEEPNRPTPSARVIPVMTGVEDTAYVYVALVVKVNAGGVCPAPREACGVAGWVVTTTPHAEAALATTPMKKSGNIFRVGIFLDFVWLTTRTPHGGASYVRRAR